MVTSRKGQPLLLLGEHSFFKKMKKRGCGLKANWACSTHHSKTMGYKSILYVEYVQSRRGKTLLKIGAYTFCTQRNKSGKARWVCSTRNNQGCRASICTVDDEIVKIYNIHNH
ncbi:FLYWCH zinc finger domain-containing protein [Phthorimaea operculella]|nr:FLYWCH zinc finger domain-containing protein [Phthorimaea operculella]